ncbi:MAG: hypothetical protein ACW98U_07625 [Candidatus Thorarchaeota archaeon]|jgi:hypothetical protein
MENFAFLRTKTFSRYYSVLTNAVLSLSLVLSLLGILGNLAIQNVAGILVVLGIGFLFGQILLVLNLANKRDKVGWILVRFTYVTLFVVILGMLSIVGGTLIASFYLLGGNSLQATVLFSSIGLTSLTSFGICLSGISYHTLSVDRVWMN